jgi:hypothetical protein
MDNLQYNLQSPAFPLVNQEGTSLEDREVRYGFTKLEYASLLIAQGVLSHGWPMQSTIDSFS